VPLAFGSGLPRPEPDACWSQATQRLTPGAKDALAQA